MSVHILAKNINQKKTCFFVHTNIQTNETETTNEINESYFTIELWHGFLYGNVQRSSIIL